MVLALPFLWLSIRPLLFFFDHLLATHHMSLEHFDRARPHVRKTFLKKLSGSAPPRVKANYLRAMDRFFYPDRPGRDLKHNVYFQYVRNRSGDDPKRVFLDDLSYFFLSDPAFNALSRRALDRGMGDMGKTAWFNLMDFLSWQKNRDLVGYFLKTHEMGDYRVIRPAGERPYPRSLNRLKNDVSREWDVDIGGSGENRLVDGGFSDSNSLKNWKILERSNYSPFGQAGFFVGMDEIDDNKMIRILNTFIHNQEGIYDARCGIQYVRNIAIDKGIYLFACDLWVKTGEEQIRFSPGRGIGAPGVKPSIRKWHKLIYLLNNKAGKYRELQPVIWMFGTGSLWVDNLFLAKCPGRDIDFSKPYGFQLTPDD